MVTIPTVLIVGAGGSQPYGYPLGREFIDSLIDELDARHTGGPVATTFRDLGVTRTQLGEFRHHLLMSHRTSIDRFLAEWPGYVDIGKLAIAAKLIPIEEPEMLGRPSDWYRYLFNRLSDNLDQGKTSKLTILTFNYDRSLDYYLRTAFKYSYKLNDEQTTAKMANLEIIHLHGILASLPWDSNPKGPRRAYAEAPSLDWIRGAIQTIKVIHEQREGDEAFLRANEACAKADRICFLGFGYDRINVQRLLKERWHLKKAYSLFIGSGHSLTGREAAIIMEQFDGKLTIVDGSSDCLNVLRHHVHVIT